MYTDAYKCFFYGAKIRIGNMRSYHSDLFKRYKVVPMKLWLTGNSTVTYWFCNLK